MANNVKNDSLLFSWHAVATIVRDYSQDQEIVIDEPGDLFVKTRNGRPFARVRIQKKHVGLYLLPMYYFPDVVPQELSDNKSGKGTLRFQKNDKYTEAKLIILIENCLAVIGYY